MRLSSFILLLCCWSMIAWGCEGDSSEEKATLPIDTNTVQQDSTRIEEVRENIYVDFPQEAVFDSFLRKQSNQAGLDWLFAKAILIKESHYDSLYISTAGAVGLMQLMPREGSYFSDNYRNYQAARKQKRNAQGDRFYQGKSIQTWANQYIQELHDLKQKFDHQLDSLYQIDHRFDPRWNIQSGVKQLGGDFQFFRKRGHGPYTSRLLAAAAYNAGRYAVMRDRANPKMDAIPINRQTELYVGAVQKIYEALQRGEGRLLKSDDWVLKQ